MKLSQNFNLEEYTKSDTAKRYNYDNTASYEVFCNIYRVNKHLMQPIRDAWGKAIVISSGYRCKQLNSKVGGAPNSQHLSGSAADFHTLGDSLEENGKLWNTIIGMKLPFDQLIWEHGERAIGPDWIHISYSDNPRQEVKFVGVK